MTHEEIKMMWCDMHKGVKMFNQELEDVARRKKGTFLGRDDEYVRYSQGYE
jgi:uncharacterized ferredoxin-like protein